MGFFDKAGDVVKLEKSEVVAKNIQQMASSTPILTASQPAFLFKEASEEDRLVITCYGEKGSGKTVTAMGFPGTLAVLCFDQKSVVVKKEMYKGDARIKVYDCSEFFDEHPDKIMQAGATTYNYTKFILDKITEAGKVDWVILDGLEIFTSLAEIMMRNKHGLRYSQGVDNRNIWKDRRLYVREIHNSMLKASKKGVIYTTYTDKDDLVENGEMVSKKKVPKWLDVIMYVTDIVLFSEGRQANDGKKFYVTVENSKLDRILKTGTQFDMTNKKISDVAKF